MTEIKINIELNMSEKMQAFIASVFSAKSVAGRADLEIVEAGNPEEDAAAEDPTPAPVKKVRRAATKKKEPDPETVQEPEGVEEAPAPEAEKKVIKLEDLRPVMAELWGRGKKEEVARILEKRKAHFLKEISPEEYGALLADFNNALHADD